MARIHNKDQFRAISVELPIALVEGMRAKAKSEHKTLTQKVREIFEAHLTTE